MNLNPPIMDDVLPRPDPISPAVRAFVEDCGDEETIIYHGFDDCIIGIAEQFSHGPTLVYDYDKVIDTLIQDGLTHEEAVEHFQFNVIGGWVGPRTPIFLTTRYNVAEWSLPANDAPIVSH